jgi:hypothetical protein
VTTRSRRRRRLIFLVFLRTIRHPVKQEAQCPPALVSIVVCQTGMHSKPRSFWRPEASVLMLRSWLYAVRFDCDSAFFLVTRSVSEGSSGVDTSSSLAYASGYQVQQCATSELALRVSENSSITREFAVPRAKSATSRGANEGRGSICLPGLSVLGKDVACFAVRAASLVCVHAPQNGLWIQPQIPSGVTWSSLSSWGRFRCFAISVYNDKSETHFPTRAGYSTTDLTAPG